MLAHRIKPKTSRNIPPQWQFLPNVFITVTRFISKCFFVNFRGAKKIKMMEEEILMFKNYVASPGIVEIRWKCDDPTQFRPPEDLFERQSMGMPEDFGKKDPLSTFQVWPPKPKTNRALLNRARLREFPSQNF